MGVLPPHASDAGQVEQEGLRDLRLRRDEAEHGSSEQLLRATAQWFAPFRRARRRRAANAQWFRGSSELLLLLLRLRLQLRRLFDPVGGVLEADLPPVEAVLESCALEGDAARLRLRNFAEALDGDVEEHVGDGVVDLAERCGVGGGVPLRICSQASGERVEDGVEDVEGGRVFDFEADEAVGEGEDVRVGEGACLDLVGGVDDVAKDVHGAGEARGGGVCGELEGLPEGLGQLSRGVDVSQGGRELIVEEELMCQHLVGGDVPSSGPLEEERGGRGGRGRVFRVEEGQDLRARDPEHHVAQPFDARVVGEENDFGGVCFCFCIDCPAGTFNSYSGVEVEEVLAEALDEPGGVGGLPLCEELDVSEDVCAKHANDVGRDEPPIAEGVGGDDDLIEGVEEGGGAGGETGLEGADDGEDVVLKIGDDGGSKEDAGVDADGGAFGWGVAACEEVDALNARLAGGDDVGTPEQSEEGVESVRAR